MYKILKNIFTSFYNYNSTIGQKNRLAEESLNFWKDSLKKNEISFTKIIAVYNIISGDYSDIFFDEVKNTIINQEKINKNYGNTFTWDKPHLHFELIITDRDKYVGAVVYPFELMDSPKILWFYLLKNNDEHYCLNELQSITIYKSIK